MTSKEFLKQYEYAARRVRRLETEYEEERIMIDAIRSVSDNDGMPHGTNISKPTEERAIRLADKLRDLVDARLDAIEARQRVFDVIDQIDGIEATVLYDRYILCMTWEKVAEDCDRSEKWCRTELHARGLHSVEIILGTSL